MSVQNVVMQLERQLLGLQQVQAQWKAQQEPGNVSLAKG